MSRIPSYRRLYEQDFPEEQRELIQQLSVSINAGFEVLYEQLNGKLTFQDNLSSTVKTFTVQVDASGKPTTKTVIKKTTTDKALGLLVVRADNVTNSSTYPTSGIFITFTETVDSLIINHITGIQADNLYSISIIALR
jgi:uncharacterized protein YycO